MSLNVSSPNNSSFWCGTPTLGSVYLPRALHLYLKSCVPTLKVVYFHWELCTYLKHCEHVPKALWVVTCLGCCYDCIGHCDRTSTPFLSHTCLLFLHLEGSTCFYWTIDRGSWTWSHMCIFIGGCWNNLRERLLNLAASTVILQWEAIWATLRLAREIWRINQSCEVLTKAMGNVQPLWVKPKVRTNEMLCKSNAKVRGNVQPLWA
jgi:hypothetical protein